jgi:beta-mannosidase
MPHIVQTGIWDKVQFITIPENMPVVKETEIVAGAAKNEDKGSLKVRLQFTHPVQSQKVKILLTDGNKPLISEEVSAKELIAGKTYENLKVERWNPNGVGEQALYRLEITLSDNGKTIQQSERRIGFRHIEWLPCEGAQPQADPWICSVNGKPLFLQGVNWTPIRPNFADLNEGDYKLRLSLYKELGFNTIRVWGGGFPEKDWLYDLCDELGILVWQDFPVSSSGLDNYPPTTPEVINVITNIADSYVARLRHHPALLLWCAGNELYEMGDVAPVTDKHPLISAVKRRVQLLDPTRKFADGSPSGPNIYAHYGNYGSGKNWDVHGPWTLPFKDKKQDMADVRDYWEKDDALFHSEVGVPGAMSVDMMKKYCGDYNPLPASLDNPLWRTVFWWNEWDDYLSTHNGQTPASLEAYVGWSQQRQADGICITMSNCKKHFPHCGGLILWMGHDSFPCMANTSIIDFDGNLKPAAVALSKILKE